MAKDFSTYQPGLDSPASDGEVITPGTTFAACRGIWVGGAGNLFVTMVSGATSVPYYGCQAGTCVPIRCTYVSTTTTATNLTAMRD